VQSEGDGFRVTGDGCSGRALPCSVWVAFDPSGPGAHIGALTASTSAGDVEVPLEAFAHGGSTALTLHSEPGDSVGQGGDYAYTAQTAGLSAKVSGDAIQFEAFGLDGRNWFARFTGPGLAVGHYEETGGRALDVSGYGGCNITSGSFDITSLTYDDLGRLTSFGATFEQHCDRSAPELRGTLAWRAGDDAAPAPWMAAPPASPPTPAPAPAASAPPPTAAPAPASSRPAAAARPRAKARKRRHKRRHRHRRRAAHVRHRQRLTGVMSG
jgi:hypothetical protein